MRVHSKKYCEYGKRSRGRIHKKQLKSLGLFRPEQKRLRGGLVAAYSFSWGKWRDSTGLWSLWELQDPREQHGAMAGGRWGWGLEMFFTRRWGAWNRFLGAEVMALSCWSSRSVWTMLPDTGTEFWVACMEPGRGLNDPCGPFHLEIFYFSFIW